MTAPRLTSRTAEGTIGHSPFPTGDAGSEGRASAGKAGSGPRAAGPDQSNWTSDLPREGASTHVTGPRAIHRFRSLLPPGARTE